MILSRRHDDPLNAMRRRQRLLWIAVAPVVTGFFIWALRPLHMESIPVPAIRGPETQGSRDADATTPQIDPQAFAVALWNPPAAPPQEIEIAAQPQPQALNIQLIGVITEGSTSKAALYDADRDRLLIVADGESVRDQVVHIHPEGIVELIDGKTTRRLVLRADREGPS